MLKLLLIWGKCPTILCNWKAHDENSDTSYGNHSDAESNPDVLGIKHARLV